LNIHQRRRRHGEWHKSCSRRLRFVRRGGLFRGWGLRAGRGERGHQGAGENGAPRRQHLALHQRHQERLDFEIFWLKLCPFLDFFKYYLIYIVAGF